MADVATERDHEQVQALMDGLSSESGSDIGEVIPLETNGRFQEAKYEKLRKKKAGRHGREGRCSKRTITWGLVVSLLVNLVFLFLLLVFNAQYAAAPPDCPQQNATSSGEHASQAGNNILTASSSSFSSSSSSSSSSPPGTVTPSSPGPTCVTSSPICGKGTEEIEPPKDTGYVNLFRDLTREEMSAVAQYIFRQTSLNVPRKGRNRIFGVELYVPVKDSVLKFLDSSTSEAQPQPPREALVTLALDGEDPPVVRQYVVGPLPTPGYHRPNPRMSKTVPGSRLTMFGYREAWVHLLREISRVEGMDHLLRESFQVTPADCGGSDASRPCLMLMPQKTSFGLVNSTSFVFAGYYNAEIPTIHPVPFQVMVGKTSGGSYAVRTVYYAGATFRSLPDLVTRYNQDTVNKVRRTHPRNVPGQHSTPGSMNLRGEPFPSTPHPPPRQYEPRGARFSVENQHIRYLEWSFNVRVSIESGPQIWDVRWSGERIVYELSLQEIVVLYAGANPSAMFAHLSDSAFGLGDNAKPLVPGVDCPDHAQFLSTWVFSSPGAREFPNSVCVFEHNAGVPLRRHSSPPDGNGRQYYGGLTDHILVVRAIIVEYNYDYVLDFVFHANGALETRVYATGYIMSSWFHYGEDPFGFQVQEGVVGSIHHHLFHFKVDLDVGGVSNRYETLDFGVDDRNWPWLSTLKPSATSSSSASSSSSSPHFQQISFKHRVRNTEQDALYHYNFDQPKYHLFYNNAQKNRFGNVRAYRLHARGFSKQLLPSSHPALRSRRWADYCMAVTQRKEEELKSSSVFSMYDADDPVVNFEDFVADNDSIVDKDLVSWVTVGMHHIPHTEDIPNTPTTGTEASILLLPFNYFPECPSMRSRDAVRVDKSRQGSPRFQTYGTESDFACLPETYGWLKASNAKNYP